MSEPLPRSVKMAILVAALGYFVDVFDLTLFGTLRIQSLKDLGLSPQQVTDDGMLLLNMQVAGMLAGGILWGLLGDLKGRVSVLFGSILLYSLATLANAFVQDVPSYAILRFIGGIGLAGEVGAGITLVAELMPKNKRGLATALVAGVGVAGGIASSMVAQHFDWRTCYIIGGVGGLLLLLMRVGVHESGMFNKIKEGHSTKFKDFRLVFTEGRWRIYLACVLLGIPLWYFAGLVVIFSPEIGAGLGIAAPIVAAKAVFSYSIGFGLGDVLSGLLSQYFQSRKKVIGGFLIGAFVSLALLLTVASTPEMFYGLCVLSGFFIGYWALLLTTSAEHFGTNIRATVTTTVPNFVRGSTVILTMAFAALKGEMGVVGAIQAIGVAIFVLAAFSWWVLRETFHQDMDFIERSR